MTDCFSFGFLLPVSENQFVSEAGYFFVQEIQSFYSCSLKELKLKSNLMLK